MPVLPLLLALVAPAICGDVHLDERRGFRIEVPEGWSAEEKEGGSERGFSLTLRPPGSTSGIAVQLQIGELRAGDELVQLSARDLEQARSGERYSELEEAELRIAGRVAPTFEVTYRAASGVYRIRRSHLVEEGSSWVLQCNAPVEEFPERVEAFERIVASFAFVELSEEGLATRRLAELAARCGSELRWARDWAEAAERSRLERKPVLVVAWLLATFTGASDARHGALMDPELVLLLNERFVPLWYVRGMEAPFVESYGVSRTAFGKAFLAMTAEGDVLFQTHELDNPSAAHEFLRRRLAEHPELPGTPVPAELAPLERAERHLARGEPALASEALRGEDSARAHRLRARIFALERRGAEALDELGAARAAVGDSATAAELLTAEATLLSCLGRDAEARAALARVLAEPAPEEAHCAALYLSSLLDLRARDGAAAERRWRELVRDHPENRFAWLAAQALRTDAANSWPPFLGWPEEPAVAEVVASRVPAPLPAERADEAGRQALAWLLAAQQEDGSWVSPTEVGRGERRDPEIFVDSIAALAGRALLRHRELERAERAARRALAFVLASIASRERTPPFTWVMDYNPWSDSCMLAFLADAEEAGFGEGEELHRAAATLIADLASRRQSGGGWTYLVTADARAGAPPAHSMSFVTAAVVLALDRAREAGFEVPPELIEEGVGCLERMRNEDHTFEYRLVHEREDAPRSTELPGAVGRGPACELALLSAGKSSPERLRRSLALFLEHGAIYAAESGKALAHAGPAIVGCHYVLFDSAHAARARRVLPADPGTDLRLRELILASRLADGSFVDNPVVGRSYATAMAVLALDDLEHAEGG